MLGSLLVLHEVGGPVEQPDTRHDQQPAQEDAGFAPGADGVDHEPDHAERHEGDDQTKREIRADLSHSGDGQGDSDRHEGVHENGLRFLRHQKLRVLSRRTLSKNSLLLFYILAHIIGKVNRFI